MGLSEVLSNLSTITSKLQKFESGDLMGVVEIKTAYEELQRKLIENRIDEKITRYTQSLAGFSEKLSETGNEGEILELLKLANQYLIEYINQPEGFPKPQVDWENMLTKKDARIAATPEPVEAKPVDKTALYEGYFNNVVDDRKMLSQLCEEVKEHLDTSQYTLVELEYDNTNQENINKVFRAFHTIKGSSAFLGLKNFEEVGHEMENLLVLVRDGKLRVSKELIDVIFMGIELLRNLVSIMETNEFIVDKMVQSFSQVDIFTYNRLVKKILSEYQFKKIGEILQNENVMSHQDVQKVLVKQEETGKKFGEIALEENLVSQKDLSSALKKQQQAPAAKKSSYVKVSNERLNALIDIVGELVINQSMLKQTILRKDESAEGSDRTISQLEFITTSIKNLVLSMGMVPIAEIFNKLRVVVRNTSQDLGKTVSIDIHGEDTELDRNVIEAIYDPLVHMVRNAIDHGIEVPEEREKAKKDRVGNVTISAEHKGNGIEISVYDDGRGINKEAILKKALSQGLIEKNAIDNISDKEVYNLMFLPGFSTAQQVTEISGRGVGLDVVKKNIESIRGRVEISSQVGKFSKFTIKLPLTLAIIEGFVTMIGRNKYVLPFNSIDEIIVPQAENIKTMDDGNLMLFNRGNYIPMIFAGKIFREMKYNQEISSMLVVVITHDGRSVGLVVDQVLGKQEIVIKSLGEALAGLSVFSGGTIFGDGTIGFVVDIEGFLESARGL